MLECDICGCQFARPNKRGRRPLRCSDECKAKAHDRLLASYPRNSDFRIDQSWTRRVRVCAVCGVEWSNIVGLGPRKYCSVSCRGAAAAGSPNPKNRVPCSQGCGNTVPGPAFQFFTQGRLSWCGCERNRYRALPWATREQVFIRDQWVCQICGEFTDIDDKDGHATGDQYPTVDHIVARADGGGHELHNLRTAHKRCNSLRGVGVNEQYAFAV